MLLIHKNHCTFMMNIKFHMNRLTFLFVLLMYWIPGIQGQTVDCSRTATLLNGIYNISGTAILERFTDGSLQLRLSEDFSTDRGPDVQIYLSNDSTSIAGGVMLLDIGSVDGINHFSGALTIPISGQFDINDYAFVVFRCVSFSAYWGGGRLGVASCDDGGGQNGGGMDTTAMTLCEESIVATTNWISSVTVCPEDGLDDDIPLLNTLRVPAGAEYAYIFADANNNIRFLHYEDSYNFEGSSLETDYVFGISSRGTLSYNVGDPITSITSDSCAILSSTTTFLTIEKENCIPDFNCVETLTATTNWATSVSVCPGDGQPDEVPLLNNQFQEPGDHYAYLITDTQNRIVDVHFESSYDFENSAASTSRVFGISYAGTLNYQLGDPISAVTADSCFQLSDTTLYLTVLKNGCDTVATTYSVSGRVHSSAGDPIEGAEVLLNSGMKTLTDASGNYQFSNLMAGEDINIKVYHDDQPANGISSTDLVITARHILNLRVFTDPYQLLAADANNNGSISASDLVQMKRVLLGVADGFANNTSWRFFDASQVLNGLGDTPTEIVSFQLNEDFTNLDFVGIKIGDVNGNARLNLNE